MPHAMVHVIDEARGLDELRDARCLFAEYLAALGIDLSFQNVADELRDLPGPYAPPRGTILLARDDRGEAAGVVALKPLDRLGAGIAEMKRLYVRPRARGTGLSAALVATVEEAARARGYRLLKLDTLGRLVAANRLYARLGYRPCAPYNENPYADIRYFEKDLSVP
ncbi:MAG: GNAT family N-acetyltransferase [Rhodothalassiaceae bacterium]